MTGRAQAALAGALLAESLSWTGLFDRARLLPPWTRRLRREIEATYEQDRLLETSLPFALNQPTGAFRSAPGPKGEWFAFQLRILVEGDGRYDQGLAVEAWTALAQARADLRLTIGQHAAVDNLARGMRPPQSGHDNPHYFDDGALFRAIPLVLAGVGDVHRAVDLDAQISHAEDGIWAAQALAAVLDDALTGAGGESTLARARSHVPSGSWLDHELERAQQVAAGADTVNDLVQRLTDGFVNHAYNFGDSAPETLAIALAIHDHTRGAFDPSLLAALAIAKTSASVAPLVGALSGACTGTPPSASRRFPLLGIALPHLAGLEPALLLADVTKRTP